MCILSVYCHVSAHKIKSVTLAYLIMLKNEYQPGAGCIIKKLLKLTMISGNVNQSELRVLYLITI